MAAGIERLDVLVGIDASVAQAIGREQVAGGGSRVGERKRMAANISDGFDARGWIGDEARPVSDWLVVGGTERTDRFGFRHLMRQHITQRTELSEFELAAAHRFDLGVVTGGDKHLDRTAYFVADQLADLFVDRHQPRRGVIGLDAEADLSAVWTIGGT